MSRYEANPNNTKKSQPKSVNFPKSNIRKAILPVVNVIQERASHILINVNGTYAFNYQSSASIGGTDAIVSNYETGSILANAAGGPIRLDINPVAWRQTSTVGDIGDVTFVYTGNIG